MKTLKIVLAALLVACAVLLLVFSLQARDSLPGILDRMDPQQLADQDTQMKKARDRVDNALLEGDREKTLRSLDRYMEGFREQLTLDSQVQMDLFFFRNGPSMIALALLRCLASRSRFKRDRVWRSRPRGPTSGIMTINDDATSPRCIHMHFWQDHTFPPVRPEVTNSPSTVSSHGYSGQ